MVESYAVVLESYMIPAEEGLGDTLKKASKDVGAFFKMLLQKLKDFWSIVVGKLKELKDKVYAYKDDKNKEAANRKAMSILEDSFAKKLYGLEHGQVCLRNTITKAHIIKGDDFDKDWFESRFDLFTETMESVDNEFNGSTFELVNSTGAKIEYYTKLPYDTAKRIFDKADNCKQILEKSIDEIVDFYYKNKDADNKFYQWYILKLEQFATTYSSKFIMVVTELYKHW